MKKLMCLLIMLPFVGSATAGRIIGNPVADLWSTESEVTVSVSHEDSGTACAGDLISASWSAGATQGLTAGGGVGHSSGWWHMWYDKVASTSYEATKYDSGVSASGPAWAAFEFDQAYYIDSMKIWNYNSAGEPEGGIKNCTIEYSTDGSNWTTLTSTTLAMAPGTADYAAGNTIDFGDVMAKYVVLTAATGADGHYGLFYDEGTSPIYGLSEVQFEEGIPEPATIVLLGLGGLTLIRRRKR